MLSVRCVGCLFLAVRGPLRGLLLLAGGASSSSSSSSSKVVGRFPHKHMEVIFTENRDKAARIVNGQQATILGCENNTIILSLPEGQRVFVYPVTRVENDTHTTRYPFSPAYAQTITKSQGRNIRHLIIWLDCDTVPPGTGYVGLSRVRTRSSISLLQPIRAHQLTPVQL